MPTLLYNWRISATLAGLPRGTFPFVGLPPVIQWFPRDYSVKTSDSEGGKNRAGYLRYELLWTRMDQSQHSAINRLYAATVDSDLYLTCMWYDTNNPVIRWVDLMGKPDLSDATPNPPAFSEGVQIFSTIRLTLNNVALVTDPATY